MTATTPEEKAAQAERHAEYNLALRPVLSITAMATAFYRRVAKRKMWVPNRIDGNVVVKPSSVLDIKTRFDPDHVKARASKRLFRGVVGARSWKDFGREAINQRAPKPKDGPFPQPNSVRPTFAPTKYVRPRTERRRMAKIENDRLAAMAALPT
jgi:hypothetical protein